MNTHTKFEVNMTAPFRVNSTTCYVIHRHADARTNSDFIICLM